MSLPTAAEALAELEQQNKRAKPKEQPRGMRLRQSEAEVYRRALIDMAGGKLSRNKMVQLAKVALDTGRPFRLMLQREFET